MLHPDAQEVPRGGPGRLNGVSQFAIWGSLGASLVLGVFMIVQAVVDPPRRLRFALFAAVWWALLVLDASFPALGPVHYEFLRVLWSGTYVASILGLFGYRARWILLGGLGVPAVGLAVWFGIDPRLATTVCYPLAFGTGALVHGQWFLAHRGYASSVLGPLSAAAALSCTIYAPAVATGDPRIVALGYLHYAGISITVVLFGWIHLPRELRGRAPVRVEPVHAAAYASAILVGEVGVIVGMLAVFEWPPRAYLASSLLSLGATLLYYFNYRHRLVIYTENVEALLVERTANLEAAREALARQNERQAEALEEQARQIAEKVEVIERQRRLELAAQTAGEAAHDIQNLVAPLLEQVDGLLERPELPTEVRSTAEGIRRRLDGLVELNGQMLALSRRGRMDRHPVRLSELAAEVAADFGPAVRVETGEEAWILGSWSQLRRTAANLVRNAIEAQAGGPPVVLQVGRRVVAVQRRCHLGFLRPGDYGVLSVEDAGPGIPADLLEQIFEPFYSTKRGSAQSGSGLGLSIVTAVVDDHGGVLDLETGPNGTRFTLHFPSIAAPAGADEAAALFGSETVVVADDDSEVRRTYSEILEAAGYFVIPAADGEATLRVLQLQDVDLLFLDIRMPVMNGFETLYGAMHLRPGIRAVVHSSYVSGEEADSLRALGVSALLEKPAGRREVLRAAREALASPRPVA